MAGFQARQKLPHYLIQKEEGQGERDNAKSRQSQAIQTNSVGVGIGIGIGIVLPVIVRLNRANGIDVRKRMRRLKDRDERKHQY